MARTHQQDVQHGHVTGWAGWVGFGAFVIALTGIYHIALGIGGVFGQDWYVYNSGTVWLFDASTWGWSMIAGGILLTITAGLLLVGNMVGRILGVLLAVGSLLANLALAPVTPIWSAIAAVLDILVIYAIIAHGGEMKRFNE